MQIKLWAANKPPSMLNAALADVSVPIYVAAALSCLWLSVDSVYAAGD